MVMSTVGYQEPGTPGSMAPLDPHNKTPKYCTKCKRLLKAFEGQEEYDPYTGDPVHKGSLICPSLSSVHDRWMLEGYGVWVNYRQI
jgi:hypothetical protein